MAKLTRAQYEKWNGQLGGGFKFDMMHYVTWGEKQAIRDIKLEDGRISAPRLDTAMWLSTFGRWRSSLPFMCRCMSRLRGRT